MEMLLFAGQHAQAELQCERKLREAHALGKYREVIRTAAHALSLCTSPLLTAGAAC